MFPCMAERKLRKDHEYASLVANGISISAIKIYLLNNPSLFDEFVVECVTEDRLRKLYKQKIGNFVTKSVPFRTLELQTRFNTNDTKEISKSLLQDANSQDLHRLILEITQVAAHVVRADGFMLYVPSNNEDELLYLDPETEQLKPYGNVGKGLTVAAHVAFEKKSVLVDDVSQDYRFPYGIGIGEDSVQSVLCLPIALPSEDLLAVVEFTRSHEKSAFNELDVQNVNTLFGWMAACLHEMNMRKVLNTQQKLNDFLLNTTKVIFDEMTSIDVLVQNIMSFTKNLVNADRCAFFLVDDDKDELFADYFDEGAMENGAPVFSKKPQIRFDKTKGIAGYVAKTGEVANIKDAYSDPRFNREIDKTTGYRTRNILCMPIISKNKVIGVVQMINSKSGDHFTNADESAFKMFAVYSALALHYSRLYNYLQLQEAQYKVAMEVLQYHLSGNEDDFQKLIAKPHLEKKEIPKEFPFYHFECDSFENIIPNLFLHMIQEVEEEKLIDKNKLCRFILTVRKNYRPVVYHNWIHGFYVAHALWVMVKTNPGIFTRHEKLALLIGGLCHDVDHRGYNNAFFQKMHLPLAALYSTSIMEQHHYRHTVTILQSEGNNIFSDFEPQEYKDILEMIRHNIIATDLALYFLNQKALSQSIKDNTFSYKDPGMRAQMTSLMMSGADLSGLTKPWEIQKKITDLVYSEFYSQGDEEKMHGLEPLPMMDRSTECEKPKQQIGFLDFVAKPLFTTLNEILPGTKPLLDGCLENRENWQKVNQKDKVKQAVDSNLNDEYSFAFEVSDSSASSIRSGNLLVDCGATAHIVTDKSKFVSFDKSFKPDKHFIELADGTRNKNVALQRGHSEAIIGIKDDQGSVVKAVLKNALLIPSYPQDIFSVQAATEVGASVMFTPDSAVLRHKNGTKFDLERHGRLYYLTTFDVCEGEKLNIAKHDIQVWHEIMEHCNHNDVSKLQKFGRRYENYGVGHHQVKGFCNLY
ncbi:hypothetical protein ScPMuIL_011040 [Solemya velum]